MRTVLRLVLSMAFLAILFVCPFFALAAPFLAAGTQESAAVTVQNGRMTLKTQAAPLLPLLEEIAGAADVQIVCFSKIPADQLVTADLSGWSVEKTLVSLLNGLNHMVIYAPGDAKRGVVLRGGTLAAGSVPGVPRAVTVAARAPGGKTATEGEGPEQATGSLRIEGRKYSTLGVNAGAAQAANAAGAVPGRTANTAAAAPIAGIGWEGRPESPSVVTHYKKPAYVETPERESVRLAVKASREEFLKGEIARLSKQIESGESDRQFAFWAKRKNSRFVPNDRALLERYNNELTTLYNISN